MNNNSSELQIRQNYLPQISFSGSLDAYIQWANKIPLLTKEEESELAKKLEKNNDLAAAQKLVTSHIRYVIKVAKGYMGYGLMLADLIQEGTIGLMKAVKRFKIEKGVRLVSFAIHWIKAEIHEFVLRNWKIVKIATTKAQRKLFFNLRSAKKKSQWLSKEEINYIAKDLNVKPSDVEKMEKRLHAKDLSFDLPKDNEKSEQLSNKPTLTPSEYLESQNANPLQIIEKNNWDQHVKEKFIHAFNKLDERSKNILTKRWLNKEENKSTLKELGNLYKISQERVRQLEQNAINTLKEIILQK